MKTDLSDITTSQYWDCNCEEDYIQRHSSTICIYCDAVRDEQPDSKIVEAESTYYAY